MVTYHFGEPTEQTGLVVVQDCSDRILGEIEIINERFIDAHTGSKPTLIVIQQILWALLALKAERIVLPRLVGQRFLCFKHQVKPLYDRVLAQSQTHFEVYSEAMRDCTCRSLSGLFKGM